MFKDLFGKRLKRSEEELALISFILKRFGYRIKNTSYFLEAITHKSYAVHTQLEISNERLEFLGDAVLDSVIAELLFLKFPEENEGYLTKIKSKVVSRNALAQIGYALELRSVLRYHKGRNIKLETLEGNAFEALMGAIYLDGGYTAVKRTIQHHIFRKYADLNKILEEEIDFKSRLFIWCQRSQLELEYQVLTENQDSGSWNYEIQVNINDKPYGKGFGDSKKIAEQAASKETLSLVGELD